MTSNSSIANPPLFSWLKFNSRPVFIGCSFFRAGPPGFAEDIGTMIVLLIKGHKIKIPDRKNQTKTTHPLYYKKNAFFSLYLLRSRPDPACQ
jgi:hypothetical protein